MQKTKLKTVALLTTMLLSNTSLNAKAEISCDQVLNKCNNAVVDLRALSNKHELLIKDQNALILTQRTKIDELESDNKSLLKNPWLWFGVGFAAGVVVLKH
jgi:hypothetical protein